MSSMVVFTFIFKGSRFNSAASCLHTFAGLSSSAGAVSFTHSTLIVLDRAQALKALMFVWCSYPLPCRHWCSTCDRSRLTPWAESRTSERTVAPPFYWRVVAGGRFELPTFGLWARRATAALPYDVEGLEWLRK